MKNFLFALVMVLLCTSCTKNTNVFSITNSAKMGFTGIEYLDGSMNDVFVTYYVNDSIVHVDFCQKIKVGETQSFEVDKKYNKAKIFFKTLPKESNLYNTNNNPFLYVKGFVYLNRDEETNFKFSGDVKIGGHLYE